MKKIISFVLIIAVGAFALYCFKLHSALDALVIGLMLGMFVRFILSFTRFSLSEMDVAYKFFVPAGLILYGVNLKFANLAQISSIAWFQIIVGIFIVLWASSLLAQKLSLSREAGVLTAVGTAICGASAIVISSMIIRPKKEDIGKALLSITVWGLLGALIYPFIQKALGMTQEAYALFISTTLSQTGFVKMAAMALGKNVETLALSIKVARTVLIIPVIMVLWFIFKKDPNASAGTDESAEKDENPIFMYLSLAAFLLVGLSFSFCPILKVYSSNVAYYSTVIWTIAMASIGMSVDVKNILPGFARNLILALLLWMIIMAVFFFGYFTIIV